MATVVTNNKVTYEILFLGLLIITPITYHFKDVSYS